MQPVTGGRHCASCEKAVTDFSRMTDSQLLEHFRTAKSSACGRFRTEQLNRVIQAVAVPKSKWWARIAAGLLLALGLSKNSEGQRRSDSVKTVMQPRELSPQHLEDELHKGQFLATRIKGVVSDVKGNPVVNAEVILYLQGQREPLAQILTDFDGKYDMRIIEGCRAESIYDLLFRSSGVEKMYTDIPASQTFIIANVTINLTDKKGPANRKKTVYQRQLSNPEQFPIEKNANVNQLVVMGLYNYSEHATLSIGGGRKKTDKYVSDGITIKRNEMAFSKKPTTWQRIKIRTRMFFKQTF